MGRDVLDESIQARELAAVEVGEESTLVKRSSHKNISIYVFKMR